MIVTHELQQLDFGGVEKVIRNLIKYDQENTHQILAYKDGAYREELESVGAKIIFTPKLGEDLEFDTDILHIHSGGAVSELATNMGKAFPVIETIHSPIRSPMKSDFIAHRVGVTGPVSKLNHHCGTIHNGLDFDDLIPARSVSEVKQSLGIDSNLPIIGRLGRIAPDKCLEDWILACYELQNRGLEFIPLIVGDEARGLSGYVGKLKLMIESLGIKNVIWAGNQSCIADFLQIMDVFLYPSPTEGFGLVFAEAMFCGATVVTYKNQVTTEVLGGYAFLVDKTIGALADGVLKALKDDYRDNLIPLAREWVEDKFSAERMAADYQDVYKKVIDGHLHKQNKFETVELAHS